MPGSKETKTVEAKTDPWKPAQPVLQDVLTNAKMYGQDPSQYTPTYSAATRDAASGIAQLGRQPGVQQGVLGDLTANATRGYGGAIDTLMSTASGGMLGGNPHLDQVLATSKQRAADATNQQFAGAGRYGSGAHTGILGDRLGAIETNARMQNYNTERANQLNAAGVLTGEAGRGAQYAGQADQAKLQQQQLLGQGGAMQDQIANAERDAKMAATERMARLATPIAGLGGTSNQTSTTATPADKMGMIIGGLTAAAGVATGNPTMAINGLSSAGGAATGKSGGQSGGGGQSGTPFFGAFGSQPKPVYSVPGSASNGGWSTSSYGSPSSYPAPTGIFGNNWFGGA